MFEPPTSIHPTHSHSIMMDQTGTSVTPSGDERWEEWEYPRGTFGCVEIWEKLSDMRRQDRDEESERSSIPE